MAKQFLTGLNLNKNELLNARIQNLATNPTSPVAGQIYYNTVNSALNLYNGTAWITLAAGGNVTEAIDAAIAALDLANTYDAKGAAAAAETAANGYTNSEIITALATALGYAETAAAGALSDAIADTDDKIGDASVTGTTGNTVTARIATAKAEAVTSAEDYADGAASAALNTANTYTNGEITTALTTAQGYADTAEANANAYTDNAVSGLAWKQAVNLLSTTNVDISGDLVGLVVDSHAPLDTTDNGYRLLLTGQTTDSENGIYELLADGSVLNAFRAGDANTYDELVGAAVYVMEGTQYGSTSWVQGNHYITSFAGQTWTQFSGQGSVTAGSGITVDGLEVSVDRTTVDTWYDASGSAASAETAANLYTDGEITDALTTAQGYATTAENNAESYADGLAVNYDAAGAAAAAEAAANLYTDGIASGLQTDIDTAVAGIFATSSGDGLVVNTGVLEVNAGTGLDFSITGAVKIDRTTVDGWYDASGSAASAQSAAETYADNAVSTQAATTETAYQTYATNVGTNVTNAFELADQGLASDISTVAGDLTSAIGTLGTDITNAIATANTYTDTVASGLSTDIDNVTTGYQSAVSALETSLTTAFQDADDVVLSTLRGEIQASAQGLDVKASVRVATIADIALTGVTAVDGITLTNDDRVLVKNQADASENGIYIYDGGFQELLRSADAGTGELTAGSFVFVEEGTHADSGFVVSTNGAITVGTTDITWTQFSGAGQIAAGTGLTKTGDTLNVIGTADRITANANSVDIASTYAGQTSIDTLGTVTTGTWEADTIDVAHGGTGATTLTGYVVGNGTGALSTVSVIPGADINGDISGNAANVTGTVAVENGGTGATTAAGARSNLAATTKYAVNNTSLTPASGSVTWTVAHNIGTLDVTVQIRDLSDNALVEADVIITNSNTVTISWVASATVTADSYRVVVVG